MPFHDSSVQPTAWGIRIAGPGLRLASALALIGSACGGETPRSPSTAHPIAETTAETDAPPLLDTPPTFPPHTTLRADAPGCLGGVPRTVELHWGEASDDIAVQHYLVFLDDALAATVQAPAASTELLDVSFTAPRTFMEGDNLMVLAGEAPTTGDRHLCDNASAYREVARIMRKLLLELTPEFLGRFRDERDTDTWFRRLVTQPA